MIYFALVALLVSLDQMTKYWFAHLHSAVPLLGAMSVVHTLHHPADMEGQWVVDLMSSTVTGVGTLFALVKVFRPNRSIWAIVAYALFLSGSLGNMLDDFWLRGADDFIRLDFGGVTIVTNLADLYGFVAVGMMAYHLVTVFGHESHIKQNE